MADKVHTLESHEAEMPNCTDPDCEFHRAPEGVTHGGLKRACNLCELEKKLNVPATYDAKTKMGPWAYVCDDHLKSHCVDNSQLRTLLSKVMAD